MVGLEASADQGELSGRRIVHGKMTVRFFDRHDFGGGMIGSLLAHIRIFAWANARCKPDASLFIHHRIVIERLAIPYRSEEHTSELQSHHDLVCRLLLE